MISIRPCGDQLRQAVDDTRDDARRATPSASRWCAARSSATRSGRRRRGTAGSCLIRLLEDVVEIADRLMIVQGEDEADAVGHDSQRRFSREGSGTGRVGTVALPALREYDLPRVHVRTDNSFIGSRTPVYPVCPDRNILRFLAISTSTSRRKRGGLLPAAPD